MEMAFKASRGIRIKGYFLSRDFFVVKKDKAK